MTSQLVHLMIKNLSRSSNVVWWLVYTFAGIVLQSLISGVDFLVPGYIVAMQEKNIKQFILVGISFIFLQEGMGTLPFGAVLLWYLLIILIYVAGHWLFEVESLPFIFLLSVASSIAYYMVVLFIANLSDIQINEKLLIDECVYQAFITPFMWNFAHYTRRGIRYAIEARN